jgi:hypothetical protein
VADTHAIALTVIQRDAPLLVCFFSSPFGLLKFMSSCHGIVGGSPDCSAKESDIDAKEYIIIIRVM